MTLTCGLLEVLPFRQWSVLRWATVPGNYPLICIAPPQLLWGRLQLQLINSIFKLNDSLLEFDRKYRQVVKLFFQ